MHWRNLRVRFDPIDMPSFLVDKNDKSSPHSRKLSVVKLETEKLQNKQTQHNSDKIHQKIKLLDNFYFGNATMFNFRHYSLRSFVFFPKNTRGLLEATLSVNVISTLNFELEFCSFSKNFVNFDSS